jgi:hypothetical protein
MHDFRSGQHIFRAPRPNRMQVFNNVQFPSYMVTTFAFCDQTFTLRVSPHDAGECLSTTPWRGCFASSHRTSRTVIASRLSHRSRDRSQPVRNERSLERFDIRIPKSMLSISIALLLSSAILLPFPGVTFAACTEAGSFFAALVRYCDSQNARMTVLSCSAAEVKLVPSGFRTVPTKVVTVTNSSLVPLN